jgi:hypothetical protein
MTATTSPLTLDDLMTLPAAELQAIMDRAYDFNPDELVGRQYLGTDLSMPKIGQAILWQTFRKTFVRDEQHGDVRGWNVRMEQHGIHGQQTPILDKDGSQKPFGHYRIRPAAGIKWPRGWAGRYYFDYGIAGNTVLDRWGFTPVVAVNEGSSDLLLGWEIFKVGPKMIAPALYWALQADGPLDVVVDPPRKPRV